MLKCIFTDKIRKRVIQQYIMRVAIGRSSLLDFLAVIFSLQLLRVVNKIMQVLLIVMVFIINNLFIFGYFLSAIFLKIVSSCHFCPTVAYNNVIIFAFLSHQSMSIFICNFYYFNYYYIDIMKIITFVNSDINIYNFL